MQPKSRTHRIEARLALIAARQHGVIARRQLLELGLGSEAIKYRLRAWRLHRVHRGIYAVGHKALSQEARWMAAVLACGDGAVLSHYAAAALWRILKSEVIEVTAPRKNHRRHSIRLHHARLPDDEVSTELRIPTTTPARTIFDLSSLLRAPALERAIREMEFLRLKSPIGPEGLLHRYPGHRGIATLEQVLGTPNDGVSANEFEDLFIAFLEEFDLPPPRINQHISVKGRSFKVDFHWPAQKVIVELDGRQSHSTAHAFEYDRERDRILSGVGWQVVHITWRQLHEDRQAIADDLKRRLAV